MDSHWFKIWPGRLRSVASSLPSGLQRAALMQVAIVYLDEGGLPADDEGIAFKTALPIELVQELSCYWKYLGRIKDDQLKLDFCEDILQERNEFRDRKARAGREGGKARPSNDKQPEKQDKNAKQKQAKPSKGNKKEAVLSSAKQCLVEENTDNQSLAALSTDKPNNTDIHDNHDLDISNEISSDEKSPQYLSFKTRLVQAYVSALAEANPDAPTYTPRKADYVQLWELWKRNLKTGPNGTPYDFNDGRIGKALKNYMASPIAKRTLAHFCTDFAVYFAHPVNEYGRPVTTSEPNASTHNADNSTIVATFGKNQKRIGANG